MKMTESIKSQIKSFLEGFYEVIPKDLISIFNEQELELLISGLPTIDIDDLKANSEYRNYQENSLQVQPTSSPFPLSLFPYIAVSLVPRPSSACNVIRMTLDPMSTFRSGGSKVIC